MKIFKAEQWNLELLLPLFEEYRLAYGMRENPERSLAFLKNRICFNETIVFIALDEQQNAVGFVQLYPRLSSLQLQRYWQVTEIFVQDLSNKANIFNALIEKAKEFVRFTQSRRLIVELDPLHGDIWESNGFRQNSKKAVFELPL
ncbi:MAG TPA: GNAT family N-acetyltransferase [Pasteurellaceae bacterium]|nr:GNAT family N-acetyltransferase [Pasteurellaceae bacterium]